MWASVRVFLCVCVSMYVFVFLCAHVCVRARAFLCAIKRERQSTWQLNEWVIYFQQFMQRESKYDFSKKRVVTSLDILIFLMHEFSPYRNTQIHGPINKHTYIQHTCARLCTHVHANRQTHRSWFHVSGKMTILNRIKWTNFWIFYRDFRPKE